MIPVNLQHLDLEISAGRDQTWSFLYLSHDTEEQPTTRSPRRWRQHLRRMKQLKTLRLRNLCGGGRCTEYEKGYSRVFPFNDLFPNRNDEEDCCYFPDLKSLEFVDCTLRLPGLLAIIGTHKQTLKDLTLSRVTLFPSYSKPYWCKVGDMCKDAVPGLTYLRLTKLVTCHPKRFDYAYVNGANAKPIPQGWTSGLEDAMTYEWKKGLNGTGKEFIGFKCPWTCDEDEDTLKDSSVSAGSA